MNGSRLPAFASSRECWLPILQLATQEVFELMLDYSLEIIHEPTPGREALDVCSSVQLSGALDACVSFHCSDRSAVRIASRMLGTELADTSPDTWDAVGELCNMIAGNFKNKITRLSDGCLLSVPIVVHDFSPRPAENASPLAAFLFEDEPLFISLEMKV